jgi:hypothetical protein
VEEKIIQELKKRTLEEDEKIKAAALRIEKKNSELAI